jgi:hypothetical protein
MHPAVLLAVRRSAWKCYRQLKGFTRSAVRKNYFTSEYIVQYTTVIVRSAQVDVSSYVPSPTPKTMRLAARRRDKLVAMNQVVTLL